MFFSNTHWTQLLSPLEILISKISLMYIPIHIHNFEQRTCIYLIRMHGEEESLSGQRLSKDHSWRIVERGLVSGSENLVKQSLHHHMLFGRVLRKIIFIYPKKISSIFSCQTRLGLQMGLASKVRWNQKIRFLATNTQDGFGEHRDKKYPKCKMKYTAVFFMLWAYISAGGPDIVFRYMALWTQSNTNR